MKHIVYILMFWIILFLSACGGGNHKTTHNDINNTVVTPSTNGSDENSTTSISDNRNDKNSTTLISDNGNDKNSTIPISDNGSSDTTTSSSGGGGTTTTPKSAGGAGQKGPFAKFSKVVAYELVNGVRSGNKVETQTYDYRGRFRFNSIPWTNPTEIVITGQYLNENTGDYLLDGNLSAIIRGGSGKIDGSVNVNILTSKKNQKIIIYRKNF